MPDRKDYAPGPTGMARMCEDRVDLLAQYRRLLVESRSTVVQSHFSILLTPDTFGPA